MGTNKCHLIPSEKRDWFGINGMGEYATISPGTVDDEANIAILQSSFHQLFDHRQFVIVPKPVRLSASDVTSTSTIDQSQQDHPMSYALAIHVLTNHEENGEFPDMYQNTSLQPNYTDRLSREFLFARFAWALFPFLRTFLDTPVPRRVAVITHQTKHEPTRVTSNDLSQSCARWMNGADFIAHLHGRGESRSGSRKRSSSQATRDESNDELDDDYEDRWQRHTGRLNSVDAALDGATAWYEQVGQYASVDYGSNNAWEFVHARHRGRSVRRDSNHAGRLVLTEMGSNADSGEVPILSRSLTESYGSSDMPSLDICNEEEGPLSRGVYDSEPLADAAPVSLMSKKQAFDSEFTSTSDTRPE